MADQYIPICSSSWFSILSCTGIGTSSIYVSASNIISDTVSKSFGKLQYLNLASKNVGLEKKVDLRLPYIGPTSTKFEKQIKPQLIHALEPRVVYTTKDVCPANKKGVLPAFQQSNVL